MRKNLFFDDNLINNIKWLVFSFDYDCLFGLFFDINLVKNKI